MMSKTSRNSMVARRPDKRPLVITRSTFVGAGSYVGHWLGDNVSAWDQYRISIRHLLQFVSFFQVPMVCPNTLLEGSQLMDILGWSRCMRFSWRHNREPVRALDHLRSLLSLLSKSQRRWSYFARGIPLGVRRCCRKKSHRHTISAPRLHLHRVAPTDN